MNWQLVLTTFTTIFLAELGDKTQLATFALATSEKSPYSVMLGAGAALVAGTVMAVLFGSYIGELVSPQWVRRVAGVLFIVMGAFYLFKA